MAQTCTKCSRANPADAVYCYYDGFALGNGHAAGAAVAGGQRGFQNPFVFPSGRSCRNFDELALACQERWQEACELLDKGYLESFLGAMGRGDLAMAAKEAARFPDRQRGLDKLLDKIPTDVLDEPKLRIEPLELNLGTLKVGTDRTFDLQLENQGMRLVYGTVTSDNCPWLAFGEGGHEKTIEFLHELAIPVKVRGDRLRAAAKPVEGRLLVETNAGVGTIVIRAEVPVTPFPKGVLSGARTPRQIAEKARTKPKEAAALFEDGAVAKWYKDNGWDYPVQEQTSSGIAAVQQFFEALGLTPPPKVDVSKRAFRFNANIGDTIRESLDLSTEEKRPVWAQASSDAPWVEVGRTKLNGRSATIPFTIPSVPNKPGQVITAHVTVVGNGNQKFVIPITLTIGQNFDFAPATPVASIASSREPEPFVPPPTPSYRQSRKTGSFWHAIPAALLAMLVFLIVMIDFIANATSHKSSSASSSDITFTGSGGGDDDDEKFDIADTDPVIGIGYGGKETHRFGIVLLKEKLDPPREGHLYKRLTFDERGDHNNTCVRLNGEDHVLGKFNKAMKNYKISEKPTKTWQVDMDTSAITRLRVRIHQTVMLVPGDSRKLDTCLVHYTITNEQDTPVKVGIRIMIDTLIGDNDGVPFSIPNHDPPVVTDKADLKDIPEYIQALEKEDLANPGTIAHVGLKGFRIPKVDRLEPPQRVVLCRWPGGEVAWDWAFEPFVAPDDSPEKYKPDSCLVIYWPDIEMHPGEVRDMAFTYGLSGISSLQGGGPRGSQLGVYAPRSVRKGDEFTVTGYVKNAQPDTPVKLRFPEGLKLVGGSAEQMPGGKSTMKQASWTLKAEENGNYDLEVLHGDGKVARKVEVKAKKSIFD